MKILVEYDVKESKFNIKNAKYCKQRMSDTCHYALQHKIVINNLSLNNYSFKFVHLIINFNNQKAMYHCVQKTILSKVQFIVPSKNLKNLCGKHLKGEENKYIPVKQ